jgi:purine-binding chemotaxis protein CheW
MLAAVSLRSLLGLEGSLSRQDMLVFRGADSYFGLLVDAVGEVLTVHPGDYEANPSTLDDRRKALFAGTYKLSDRLLVMLDPERLDPMRLAH